VSKKKDRARAAAGEVFREGKVSKMTRCPIPNCPRYIITGNSAHGLCPQHEEFLEALLFLLPRIQIKQQTPGGLVLPGQPGFQAVPESVIKEEIEKRGRIKP